MVIRKRLQWKMVMEDKVMKDLEQFSKKSPWKTKIRIWSKETDITSLIIYFLKINKEDFARNTFPFNTKSQT